MDHGPLQTSRRRAIQGGLAGLAGIGLGRHASARRQDHTPSGRTVIITAERGSLLPADEGMWELRLERLGDQILMLSDSPNLSTELVGDDTAFAELLQDAAGELAALTIKTADHRVDTLALGLDDATYDRRSASATFRARLLNAFTPHLWQGGFEVPMLVVSDRNVTEDMAVHSRRIVR